MNTAVAKGSTQAVRITAKGKNRRLNGLKVYLMVVAPVLLKLLLQL